MVITSMMLMLRMVSMLSDSSAMRLSLENPLFGKLVLSDFNQSNLRRGYDNKCRHCPPV